MINEINAIRRFVRPHQSDGYALSAAQRDAVERFSEQLKQLIPSLPSVPYRNGTMRSLTTGSEWDMQGAIPGLEGYCHVSVASTGNEETAYIYFDDAHEHMFCLW